MSQVTEEIVRFVRQKLESQADPEKATGMAAYMKTSMPFYGVQKPQRIPILKHLKANFPPADRAEYESAIKALWQLPHREEKYLALDYATSFVEFADPGSLPFFETLVRQGAWWDFVDVIAGHLIGNLFLAYRDRVGVDMDRFVSDENLWIRRTAILSQLKHKAATDEKRLFGYCSQCASEKEFFIAKAIGWALREYSYTSPETVGKFLLDHKQRISPLSFREGAKHLLKAGLI
ncbi:MAG: DNA alkylation repair protein [Candidatus Obscuribacterales bacterium]|nr:DNA alkylation repair protein [Candidatus Obscuribacterales bacterium]